MNLWGNQWDLSHFLGRAQILDLFSPFHKNVSSSVFYWLRGSKIRYSLVHSHDGGKNQQGSYLQCRVLWIKDKLICYFSLWIYFPSHAFNSFLSISISWDALKVFNLVVDFVIHSVTMTSTLTSLRVHPKMIIDSYKTKASHVWLGMMLAWSVSLGFRNLFSFTPCKISNWNTQLFILGSGTGKCSWSRSY